METVKSLTIRKKEYVWDKEVVEEIEKIINNEALDTYGAKIHFLLVYPYISKNKIAELKKTSPEHEFDSGYQYVARISGDIWDVLQDENGVDENTKSFLITHLLQHIDYKVDKEGVEIFNVKNHTFSDFEMVLNRYGTKINSNLKVMVSSIRDIENSDKIVV